MSRWRKYGVYMCICVHAHFRYEKEGNLAICDKVDGHYDKWDKSDREMNTVWPHMINLIGKETGPVATKG